MESADLVKDRDVLNALIKGCQDDCRTRHHIGVQMIQDFTGKIKNRYCTDDVRKPAANAGNFAKPNMKP